jgi:hypothetical protein
MTPQQRRRHNGALSEVAVAAHKRYLGRPELLTGIQSAWIKSLLTMWGKAYAVVQPPGLPAIPAGRCRRACAGQIKR